MLSTKHKMTASHVNVRTRQGRLEVMKPDVVLDYNINKTGVDHSDQLMSYYPFDRKSMKWWKKVFFHLVVMGVVNSFIIYKQSRENNNCHLADFIRNLAKQLVEKGGMELQSEQSSPSNSSINRLSARHFPEKIPATEKKLNPTRKCKVCVDKGKADGNKIRRETRYYCAPCNVPLCVPQCFATFHTKASYSK